MAVWTIVAALSAVLGNAIAVAVAMASLRKAQHALDQAEALAREARDAHYRIEGASAAIAWREQVISLHDRGLTAEQIRRIMELEDEGEGYEASNGRIDDILRDIPSQTRAE
jgi:DNA-binding transcriptional MerR regulator